MPRSVVREVEELLRVAGVTPARVILARLGISQPTLSRAVGASRGEVLRLGRARATRYALAREVRALGRDWPVHRVDAAGRVAGIARLHAIHPEGTWYETRGRPPGWLAGGAAGGVFRGLPWFLDDERPQGFLGRAFARRHGEALGLGPDPRLWEADDVLAALLSHGDDLPGDLVVGDRMLERVQRATPEPPEAVAARARSRRYPVLADRALAGDVAGSSAGGEQPKFSACVRASGGEHRRVLVKFSPVRDTAAGRRWCDLLACEGLAAQVLRDAGVETSACELLEGGGRAFLEVARFDRVGARGRRGVVSLLALDAEHYGRLDSWLRAAGRLERDGWLDATDASRLRLLHWFGQLIGNTDMHFANVSLLLDGELPLRLAPVYDMLPMHYRPAATGELLDRPFDPPPPPPDQLTPFRAAAALAVQLWRRAAADRRISAGFRRTATRNADVVVRLAERFG